MYFEGTTNLDVHHNDFPAGGGIVLESDGGYNPSTITDCSHASVYRNDLIGGGITYTCSNSASKPATTGGGVPPVCGGQFQVLLPDRVAPQGVLSGKVGADHAQPLGGVVRPGGPVAQAMAGVPVTTRQVAKRPALVWR